MRLRPSHPLDRRQHLLAFAQELIEELGALDLDTIDGEFYWRWCRIDLLDRLDAQCAGIRLPGDYRPDLAHHPRNDEDAFGGRVEPEGAFDFLREGLRFARSMIEVADEAARHYPLTIWQRMLDGERVAMRGANGAIVIEDGKFQPPILTLRVFSGAWTGLHVEDEMLRLESAARAGYLGAMGAVGHGIDVHVGFRFIAANPLAGDREDMEPTAVSHVLVEAPLPLPPKGTIAREYDELVRGQCGWHLDLPGSGSKQDPAVAVRTWTVGLLLAMGEEVNDALSLMHSALGLADVSQTRFGQDRKRLVERVPEAEPYLYSRRSADTDTRANPSQALVLPSVDATASQPEETDASLFR